jgi:dTDP-N-acetylfucosamine:lipid II N-acetylfucosaminyltransferase
MPDRIIHFAQDEKFINSAYRQFEAVAPGKNEFRILTASPDFKHVAMQPGIWKSTVAESVQSIAPAITKNDLVIFHSLADVMFPIVLALKKDVPTVWFCFGYEIYNDNHFYSENVSFDMLTKARFGIPEPALSAKIKSLAYQTLQLFKPGAALSPIAIKKKAIARIDCLASSFDEEFEAIQKLIGHKKKPFAFWYYPIENMVNIAHEIANDRPDILIGNSGHATGNHLDVFEKIKHYKLDGRKAIVPLSYGNRAYIDAILPFGKDMLGDPFYPLTDFMTLDAYNEMLARCGVAILNCRRQQAVGNTIALLWFGSKVFLSKHNPFFHYLRRIGVGVFSYENDLNQDSCNTLLSAAAIAQNRKVLLTHLNADLLLQELKADIEALSNQ